MSERERARRGEAATEQELRVQATDADRGAAARLSRGQIRELATPDTILRREAGPGQELSGGGATAGQSLPEALRREMEPHYGDRFDDVRVHADSARAPEVGALAYTQGTDIHFAPGQYAPESAGGRELLAHELTHVVQQRGREAGAIQMRPAVGRSDSPAEREADETAARATRGGPEIAATDEALGDHVAKGMDGINTGAHSETEGIHYAHNYKRSYPHRWQDDYWSGYADPSYFTKQGFMNWSLKPGKSASEAVKAWLKGLTIAECLTSVVMLQIDALRAAIGDKKFDDRFGSAEKNTPAGQRLHIHPGLRGTPVGDLMVGTDAANSGETGGIGKRPAKRGEWYYFYNHPKYLLKHPGGAWQGENALCMGEQAGVQIWSGFGASNVTEDEMMDQMVRAYGAPRTDRDKEVLKDRYGDKIPKIYQEGGGEFADSVTKEEILNAPAYTIDGTTRKGGFMAEAGAKLDAGAIKAIANET